MALGHPLYSSGKIWDSAHTLEVKSSVLGMDVSPVPASHQLCPTGSTHKYLAI